MRMGSRFIAIMLLVLFVAVGCANSNGKTPSPSTLLQSIPVQAVEYTAYGDAEYVTVYMLHKTANYLVPISVEREVELTPFDKSVELLNGSLQIGDFRTVGSPQSQIHGAVLQDGIVTLQMAAGFQNWVVRNLAEERNFVQAAVLTFTSFCDVTAVQFLADSHRVFGTVSQYSLEKPIPRPQIVNSAPGSAASVILYLRLRGTNILVPYSKQVERREPLSGLNELFNFRGIDDLVSPIPGGINIKSLRIEDGTAVLNLDKGAVSHILQGTLDEQLVLDGLIHTLLEFSEVRQIQILIDGRVLGPVGTNVDLSRTIGRTPVNRYLPRQ